MAHSTHILPLALAEREFGAAGGLFHASIRPFFLWVRNLIPKHPFSLAVPFPPLIAVGLPLADVRARTRSTFDGAFKIELWCDQEVWVLLDFRSNRSFWYHMSEPLSRKSSMPVKISRDRLLRCVIGLRKGERPKCAFSRKLNFRRSVYALWSSDRNMVYGFEKLSRQAILLYQAISLVNFRRTKTDVCAHAH
jgi:hypothetical protein